MHSKWLTEVQKSTDLTCCFFDNGLCPRNVVLMKVIHLWCHQALDIFQMRCHLDD